MWRARGRASKLASIGRKSPRPDGSAGWSRRPDEAFDDPSQAAANWVRFGDRLHHLAVPKTCFAMFLRRPRLIGFDRAEIARHRSRTSSRSPVSITASTRTGRSGGLGSIAPIFNDAPPRLGRIRLPGGEALSDQLSN
jgi:hypothetical protein